MRGDVSQWSPNTQKRVALDYVTNIAAGMSTLAQKWNQIWTDTDGQAKVHDGDPAKIENWYLAVWAYNSGWHAKADAWKIDDNGTPNNGAWGVGWTNNPANSTYRPDRRPFLDNNNYSDAAHPQDWPYQEKVLGWAYNYAWWTNEGYRTMIVPTISNTGIVGNNAFCAPGSECRPPATGNGRGTCQRSDFKCWWHFSTAWKDCSSACGHEASLRYDSTWASTERAEPQDHLTPCHTPGLPYISGDTKNVLIVDDGKQYAIRGNCNNNGWDNHGTLSFEFAQDSAGRVPARADFQQLGNGFGGHEWFAYSRAGSHNGDVMKVTGTWELDQHINGWARVLVHIPKRRAETQQAPYTVHIGDGSAEYRTLNQSREVNEWYNLGVFEFKGPQKPKVSLTNRNDEGDGSAAVSWDAIAFQVLARRPKHFVVAMVDSVTSGEGVGNYYPETDFEYKTPRWNACRRSRDAWIRQTVLPGETQTIGQLADSPKLDFTFIACSGAATRDLTVEQYAYMQNPIGTWSDYRDGAQGRFREAAQLNGDFLTKNTTLVALTLGANDADWDGVILDCLLGIRCRPGDFGDDLRADILETLNTRVTLGEQANVANILKEIEYDADNKSPSRGKKAKIVLMGYPDIAGASPPLTLCGQFGIDAVGVLGRASTFFAAEARRTVEGLKNNGFEVSFADPLPAFQGHGTCGTDRWVNDLMFGKTGPGDFTDVWTGCLGGSVRCASRSSFHPTKRGAQEYATVFGNHLRSSEVNYTGW
ncbi:hypothetical protein [Herbidospora cretacea]|uniref:golvesin C-terminal-like domain-containing protein n=1 Tax=Herbidospora cretacea TaxID=28444 RepID=UPI00068A4899|nr:hypothetical protein [Herbidospora cretacea]